MTRRAGSSGAVRVPAGLVRGAVSAAAVAAAVALVLAAAVDTARAQEFEGRRHIAVSGEGSVRARPDIAHADLGVRVTGESVGELTFSARLDVVYEILAD